MNYKLLIVDELFNDILNNLKNKEISLDNPELSYGYHELNWLYSDC